MASSMQEQHPTVLEELKKKAASIDVKNNGVKAKGQSSTAVMIMNCSKTDMKLMEEKEWSGFWQSGGPTPVIPAKKDTPFVHIGALPAGSKAAVRYAALGHQWILAWHVPLCNDLIGQLNKLYFDHGREGPVDWDAVEKKLDESVNPRPPPTPAGFAEISEGSDAKLVAGFTVPITN